MVLIGKESHQIFFFQKKCFLGHPSIHVAKRPCSGDDDDHNDATDIQNIPGWPPFTVPTTLHLTLF